MKLFYVIVFVLSGMNAFGSNFTIISVKENMKGGDFKTGKPPIYKAISIKVHVNNMNDTFSKTKIENIVNDVITQHKKVGVDAISVLLYGKKERSYAIATGGWWPIGHSLSRANIANILNKNTYKTKITILKLSRKVKDIAKGMSEKKRMAIWKSLILSEDRGNKEANSQYGEYSDKAYREGRKLVKKYRLQLIKKFGITESQLVKISSEGQAKNWPFPKY